VPAGGLATVPAAPAGGHEVGKAPLRPKRVAASPARRLTAYGLELAKPSKDFEAASVEEVFSLNPDELRLWSTFLKNYSKSKLYLDSPIPLMAAVKNKGAATIKWVMEELKGPSASLTSRFIVKNEEDTIRFLELGDAHFEQVKRKRLLIKNVAK
jgi:hypothetical protein